MCEVCGDIGSDIGWPLGLMLIWCVTVQPQVDRVPVRIIVLETQEKAEHVLGELKAGADFAAVAKAESTDPTAAEGGSLGMVTPEGLRTELRSAMQGLGPASFQGSCACPPATRSSKLISPPTSPMIRQPQIQHRRPMRRPATRRRKGRSEWTR